MTLAVTQSDFKSLIKENLDKVNDEKKTSLEYAIARDQLIKHHVITDDPIVESDDNYWGQFK